MSRNNVLIQRNRTLVSPRSNILRAASPAEDSKVNSQTREKEISRIPFSNIYDSLPRKDEVIIRRHLISKIKIDMKKDQKETDE